MRPFERRAANAYPFFKLATWDNLNCTWHEGRGSYTTETLARMAAGRRPGKYRISRVEDSGRFDLNPFQV